MIQDIFDILGGAFLENRIIQHKGQGDKPIQPVGRPLPTLGAAPKPARILHIRPDFIQVPAQAIRLDAKLPFQPTQWTHRAQRQGGKRNRF